MNERDGYIPGVPCWADPSHQGVSNAFKYLAEVYTKLDRKSDLPGLSTRLAETPYRPLHKRHASPGP